FLLGAVDEVGILDAAQRAVGRDNNDIELVDLGELFGFGVGGAGHAGPLGVLAGVVLEGDGSEGPGVALDLYLLLPFFLPLGTVAPAAAWHQASGELVDDDDFAVLHHVVDVAVEDDMGAKRLVQVVEHLHVFGVVEAGLGLFVLRQTLDHLLGLGHAALGQRHR